MVTVPSGRLSPVTVERKRKSFWVFACKCARCGWAWDSFAPKAPTRCPGCHSRDFNTPARPYKRRKKA